MSDHTMQEMESPLILVVDDSQSNLTLLAEILTAQGYQVRTALSGQSALEIMAGNILDLVLLDVNMPDIDGYEVCRRLKADEKNRNIPVVFISGLMGTADKVRGFEAGGVDFITKPFQSEEIMARIGIHLTMRRLQEQLEVQNVQLQQEIAERKQTEEELIQHKSRLEELVAERTMELRKMNDELQREIAERKKAEQTLRKSEEKYRTIFENNGNMMLLLEEDTTISMCNKEFEKVSGFTREEVEGKKKWTEFIANNDDLMRMVEYNRLRMINPQSVPGTYEFQSVNRKGEVLDISAVVSLLPDTRQSLVALLDITDRKHAEEALKEGERKYRVLFENANDAIFLMQGPLFVECNEKTLGMFRCAREEIIDQPPYRFSPPAQPDGRDSVEKALEKITAAFSGEPQFF